jgi:hypothetical protein
MPRFLDLHARLDGNPLRKFQNGPVDEIGIIYLNILYNPEVEQYFCLIEAPTMEAVQKQHDKFSHFLAASDPIPSKMPNSPILYHCIKHLFNFFRPIILSYQLTN